MKPLIFRFACAFTSLLFGGFWIECGSFDAVFCAITITTGIVFASDVATYANDYTSPYRDTGCGCITWVLFRPKK